MAETTKSSDANGASGEKLDKQLGLWDVYCISTGAMFSSGFFLLPGLATVYAGPSTVLAYLIAGVLMVPSMLSMVELATALPKAGGSYYFLDRSLGPGVGTIGGLGTWLSLVLKSGFALLGMGAYLAITPGLNYFFDPQAAHSIWLIKALAVALAVIFAAVNIFGAKQSSKLQNILVIILLLVLGFFVIQGLWYVGTQQEADETRKQFTPFLHAENGIGGLITTIGLVFVSYAGLTKVASVSEEVRHPEKTLPLGMFLSLLTATVVYVVGVFIMVAVLDPSELRTDYTPVATAAEAFFDWLPEPLGLLLVVVAALAAFASTGNAGILAASRYPLAMSRDRLLPDMYGKLGKFGTPTAGILVTTALMIFFIVALPAEGVAKLASAFSLMVFGMVNLAVIVMRESRIEGYDPGYRLPFYPWMPIAGALISGYLVFEMGLLAISFSLGFVVLGALWYYFYARHRVERYGAIYHVFERLGRNRHMALNTEFRQIIKEKGLRDRDPFDAMVASAKVLDADADDTFDTIVQKVGRLLEGKLKADADVLARRFLDSGRFGGAPIANGAALPHFRSSEIETAELVMVRSKNAICISLESDDEHAGEPKSSCEVHAIFFLVSPEDNPGQHLRMLAQIASRIEDESFMAAWLHAKDQQKLKEILLRDEHFLVVHVGRREPTRELIGKRLSELKLPEGTLIAMIRREGNIFIPTGRSILREEDRLTIIGEANAIEKLQKQWLT